MTLQDKTRSPLRNAAALVLAASSVVACIGGSAIAAPLTVADVVVDDLANPRGIIVGPDGAIYVAEAGSGGDGPSIVSGSGAELFYGLTGAVTRLSDGMHESVVSGLPSLALPDGSEATGIHDLAFGPDGTLYGVIGFGADPSLRDGLGGTAGSGLLGQLVAITPDGVTPVADLAAFELASNPAGDDPNSNPYSVVATPEGWVVADAGGNDLLLVAPDGTISTRAVLDPEPNPLPFGPPFYQSVPTGTALAPDGSVLVVQLTGFPFPEGGADVFSVDASGLISSLAGGFTNLIDVAVGPDGAIFALEFDSDSLINPGLTGSLWQIDDLGVRTLLYAGLLNPTGVAVGPDGRIYVVENGLSPDGGRVLALGAAVPLPGAMALMASGLAGLGLVRARRRSSTA